jgi:hypothetical protein
MRTLSRIAARMVCLAAAAATVSACSGDPTANSQASEADSNVMFEELGNDASALEAAGNADLAPPPTAGNAAAPSSSTAATPAPAPAPNPPPTAGESEEPILGQTKGGDTGGNTVGNISGL